MWRTHTALAEMMSCPMLLHASTRKCLPQHKRAVKRHSACLVCLPLPLQLKGRTGGCHPINLFELCSYCSKSNNDFFPYPPHAAVTTIHGLHPEMCCTTISNRHATTNMASAQMWPCATCTLARPQSMPQLSQPSMPSLLMFM